MKVLFIIALTVASEVVSAEETATARVCFVRHEDGGKLNIVPVRIYGTHANREQLLAMLVGGAEACVDVDPGDWSFEARSSQPYAQHAGNPKACRSNPLMTDATAEAATRIEISPKSKGSKYLCGWRLRRERDIYP